MVLGALVLGVGLIAYTGYQRLQASGTPEPGAFGIADYTARETGGRRPAPEFAEEGLDGGEIRSSLLEGKVAVVNFWASWCGPCRKEAPALQRTWEEYSERGVQFLGVDFQDDRASALAFVDEFGLTYPSAFDPTGSLAYEFSVLAIPTTFVIGPDGWIEYQFTGIVTDTRLRDILDGLLDDA